MQTVKTPKGKGLYMKNMPKNKARKVMQARANDRWSKATPEYKHACACHSTQGQEECYYTTYLVFDRA